MADWGGANRWLYRLPRPIYWAVGAAVSFGGAVSARHLAQGVPPSQQVIVWLGGATVIFIGLAILSMGTRARLETERLLAEAEEQATETGGNDDPRRGKGP